MTHTEKHKTNTQQKQHYCCYDNSQPHCKVHKAGSNGHSIAAKNKEFKVLQLCMCLRRYVHAYMYMLGCRKAMLMQRHTTYVVVCSVHPLLCLQVLEVVDAKK